MYELKEIPGPNYKWRVIDLKYSTKRLVVMEYDNGLPDTQIRFNMDRTKEEIIKFVKKIKNFRNVHTLTFVPRISDEC